MSSNTHFAVAIHSLCVLGATGRVTSSEQIAQSVGTNPVVVRRILGNLVKAGLLSSESGKYGGFSLAEQPDQMSLAAVLRAVEEEPMLKVHENDTNQECFVSCGIKEVLGGVFRGVGRQVHAELEQTTLADVLRKLH